MAHTCLECSKGRISELEAENAKYKDALDEISWLGCSSIPPNEQGDAAIRLAQNAVKENGIESE